MLAACQTTELASESRAPSLAAERPRDARNCVEAIYSKPEYRPLAGKLHLGDDPAPSSYLRNAARPDKNEMTLLSSLRVDLHECRKIATDGPLLQPNEQKALADAHAAEDKILAEASAGRLTWGKLNEGLSAASAQRQSRFALTNVGRNVGSQGTATAASQPADSISQAKRPTIIDFGYDDPNKTRPVLADAPTKRGPRMFISGGSEKSAYCDTFRYTKYCGM